MDSHLHVRAVSPNRVAGAVIGACYVLIGVAGLTVSMVTGFGEEPHLLVFQLNPLHNVLHLALGTALGLAAYRGARHSMLVNAGAGVCYGVLGLLGLVLLGVGVDPFELNGPVNHGFPARMIVPGFYGYTSATKWVVELTATRFDQVQAYWTERDWDPRGVVKTASRIDVPRPFERVSQGDVTVAGVAWAQHRGISAVQVRMDGGPWQDAELSTQVSADTWRQWRTTFTARPGTRRFEVRAADGNGDLQTDERTRPFPNGASGWHSAAVTVTP